MKNINTSYYRKCLKLLAEYSENHSSVYQTRNLLREIFTILTIIFLIVCSLKAQNRTELPVQVQLNFSGVFFKTFENVFSDSETDRRDLSNWAVPGISAGYHFRQLLYAGYSYTPARRSVLQRDWSFGGENDGDIWVNHTTGHLHNIELRVSPFEIGFYGQVFFNHIPKVNYTMEFRRKFETVLIGENEYATDLLASWNFKTVNALGIGFGYNWIHKNGISINLGMAFPIIQTPYYENIEVVSNDPAVQISLSDIELAKQSVAKESFYFPIQIILNAGYNFRLKKTPEVPVDRF